MIDTRNWNIDIKDLIDYKKYSLTNEYFFESFDKKYGVYIYNIEEWRMMAYGGLFAIFDKLDADSILNSSKTWIWFDYEKTIDYAPISDCLIMRKPAYLENSSNPPFPFLLIKPIEKKFGFIPWDNTSIYYGFNELEKNKLVVKEVHPKDLKSAQQRRTSEIINIDNLNWYDFSNFDNALELYHKK